MAFRSTCSSRLFLFDLDGTLIDSKNDIAASVNLSLERLALPKLPEARVSEFIGDGIQKLIQRALREATGTDASEDQACKGVGLFLEEYENHLLDSTQLYPGVKEGLDRLYWAEFAIVTNKPEKLSRKVLEALGLGHRFRTILGGDSIPLRKPDPAPLREAMRRCGATAPETVMVGDSPGDIKAGRAAGVITCGIAGGFRGREALEAAGCDLIVESFSEIPDHFCPPGK
jgi:phosphoglycolate phosphatase